MVWDVCSWCDMGSEIRLETTLRREDSITFHYSEFGNSLSGIMMGMVSRISSDNSRVHARCYSTSVGSWGTLDDTTQVY
ncbi:hypothetical protein TNCV_4891661 [Trichonephila clavipes]|nr:hypothetical protein TNCV_4891661 [Trichonephila clavipes]